MKTIYALSGRSGSGKTFRRQNDPELKDLKYFDIADDYHEFTKPDEALSSLLTRIMGVIESSTEDIVVEAYFKKGSQQRFYLEYYTEKLGYKVKYIELDTPIETCIERVKKDYEEKKDLCKNNHERARLEIYTTARLRLLQKEKKERDYLEMMEYQRLRHR